MFLRRIPKCTVYLRGKPKFTFLVNYKIYGIRESESHKIIVRYGEGPLLYSPTPHQLHGISTSSFPLLIVLNHLQDVVPHYSFSGLCLLGLMLWAHSERGVCSPFFHPCCFSSTAITQQKYCTIKVLFSEVTRDHNINKVLTLDLVFPGLLCFCSYFLIITPSRHCLPIETGAKWVENSARFYISSGYCRHYQLIKTTNSKETNKTFSLTLRYHYLMMTIRGAKDRDANCNSTVCQAVISKQRS